MAIELETRLEDLKIVDGKIHVVVESMNKPSFEWIFVTMFKVFCASVILSFLGALLVPVLLVAAGISLSLPGLGQ
jgi:hypothetical protein